MLGHSVSQRCGNDGFHSYSLLRHSSLFNTSCADIVKKQYAHFIAAYQLVGAVRAFHGDTYTVCVRVCGKHQVGACLLRQIQSLFQSLENLRVRVAAGSKVSVGIFLIRYDGNVCNTDIFQNLGHRHKSGTV